MGGLKTTQTMMYKKSDCIVNVYYDTAPTDIVRLTDLILDSGLSSSDPCDRYTIRTATHVVHIERGAKFDR